MSNTFNISVKPEIAAAVAKIDAIKADTGPIRLDVTDIHDSYLPAVITDTGAIRNDMNDVHDTMLPDVIANTNALRNDVTDIHDTEIPFIKTKTISILNRANAIKAKTDLFPQNVRGRFLKTLFSTSESAFQTALEVTGHGHIYFMNVRCAHGDDTLEFRLTIDGLVFELLEHTGDNNFISLTPYQELSTLYLQKGDASADDRYKFDLSFDRTLLLELRRSAGTTGTVAVGIVYAVDDF
ncbi:hypothetical protein ES703_16653 [subsurface metagenome]